MVCVRSYPLPYEALPLWRQRGRTALRKLCGPGLCDASDRWFDADRYLGFADRPCLVPGFW